MLGQTNQNFDSSNKHEQATAKQSRGQAAMDVRGSSARGGLDPVRGGRRGARNRAAVRSGGRGLGNRMLRNRGGMRQSQGAIHVEGAGGVNAHQLTGSVFSHWKVARWAQKLRLENRFELKDGKLTVSSPGIYYLYAQINYLDESDVNGFQIYVNDSPTFLCTAMTHTPTLTTKANTCYTGSSMARDSSLTTSPTFSPAWTRMERELSTATTLLATQKGVDTGQEEVQFLFCSPFLTTRLA